MDINVAGGAYLHISQDANFQRCVNMFTVGAGEEVEVEAKVNKVKCCFQLPDSDY